MKKILLSITAVAALTSTLFAMGEQQNMPSVLKASSEQGVYVGGAYGYAEYTVGSGIAEVSENFNSVMLQGGYTYNQYIGIEARYWFGLETEDAFNVTNKDTSIDTFGIYLKPSYPIAEDISLYGLLGYATSTASVNGNDGDSFDGFSYGVGAAYAFNQDVSVFVDYTSMYSDAEDVGTLSIDKDLTAFNFGVTYNF